MKTKIKKILNALECPSSTEVSVLFVGDEEIRGLNAKYLNRDYPTDVISFPMREGEDSGINDYLLGDVVVSLDNAKEYAEKKNVTIEEETIYLLIHGILHLCGYDHEKEDSDAKAMKKKEEELFKMITKGEE